MEKKRNLFRTQLILILALLSFIASCSKMRNAMEADPAALLNKSSYRLLVRTDTPEQDKIVYEYAMTTLARVLPIHIHGPYSGTVSVFFSSHQKVSALWGTIGAGRGWYSGGSATNVGVGIGSAGSRTYETATMLVVVKNNAGKRLWYADYSFNGRLTFVSSPEEAARRSLNKITGILKEELAQAPRSPLTGVSTSRHREENPRP